MVRSLALAVALALGTVTAPVHALGLGDIQSRSALNQQFDADIELLSVSTGELEAVRARLATVEAFERAGIERPFFLTLLKFRPERLDNGDAVIRVSSDFPIREPFLNFLLEVNWPRGKLVREYTVLLDPPTLTQRRAPQVQPAPAKMQSSQPTPVAPSPTAPVPPVSSGVSEYGPVKANETLWGIASKLRPRGATMQQMMMALLQANPQAFIDGNVNQLRKGQILRVPGAEEVMGIDRGQALQAVREQQAAWNALRERADSVDTPEASSPQAVEGEVSPRAEEAGDPQLRIATARPEGEGEAGASEDRGDETLDEVKRQLLLARENAESTRQESAALRGEIGDLQKRLSDMKRLIALKDEQLARLQDSVAEGDLGPDPVAQAMQDAEQASQEATGTQGGEPGAPVAERPLAPSPDAPSPDAPSIDTGEGVKYPIMEAYSIGKGDAVAPAAVESPDTAALPVKQAKVEAEVAKSTTPAAEARSTQPPPIDKPATPQPPVKPKPAAVEPGRTMAPETVAVGKGNFVTDYLPWLIGGGGVLIILLLLLLSRRHKDDSEEPLEEGTAAPVSESESEQQPSPEAPVEAAPETAQAAPPEQEDTSFLSEFSPSDINALRDDTGDVDPVSEADVYIAYGRYQQAEELLRQAMDRDDDRLELRHKLLEVYYAMQNRDAYVTLAQDMLNAGQDIGDPDAWARAKEMGRELDAQNPLFQGAIASGQGNAAAAAPSVFDEFVENQVEPVAPVDDDSLSLDDLDLNSLADELSVDGQADSELLSNEFDNELDTGLGTGLDTEETDLPSELDEIEKNLEEDSQSVNDLESLELDLPDLDSSDLASALNLDEASGEARSTGRKDSESLLADDSDLSVEELQAQLEELSDLSMLDADLSQMTADLESDLESTELTEPETGLEQETLDQPISLDDAFELEDLDDAEEIEDFTEASGPEDEDAAGTKLDLARAYIEMGDHDGARGILEEVKQEGNAEQLEEADKLLSDIG